MFKPTPEQIVVWVQANFESKPRKRQTELCICNPFDGDTGYNFNISIHKGTCYDWRGNEWANGKSLTFLNFVRQYRQYSYIDAVKEVCGDQVNLAALRFALKGGQREAPEEVVTHVALPDGAQLISESNTPKMAADLCKWLESRGISREEVQSHKIMHFTDTVIWPYYEYDELVFWQSRSRINKVYRFPDNAEKSHYLYGFDHVEPSDYIILTEAIFGAFTLKRQAVASGGAILSSHQVQKMRVLNPKNGVILGPDNDKAGKKSVISNCELISPYFPVYYSLPDKIPFKDSNGEDKLTKYLKVINGELREVKAAP
jgi:DNA primase